MQVATCWSNKSAMFRGRGRGAPRAVRGIRIEVGTRNFYWCAVLDNCDIGAGARKYGCVQMLLCINDGVVAQRGVGALKFEGQLRDVQAHNLVCVGGFSVFHQCLLGRDSPICWCFAMFHTMRSRRGALQRSM